MMKLPVFPTLIWSLVSSLVCSSVSAIDLATEPVVEGVKNPVAFVDDPLNTGRKFIVEKGGRILILKNGSILSTPFLDVSSIVRDVGEGGLLGLAFHPNYADNGFLFINYTQDSSNGMQTIVRRIKVTNNPDVAALGNFNQELVLSVNQPFGNHNGGQLLFGPKDDLLYIFMGDGGSGGDPNGNGQNKRRLLGKILRVRPTLNGPAGYTIPSNNPFVRAKRARKEIFHYGLRNPWRNSFDRQTGDLYVGDVGQRTVEEVSLARAGRKGLNFGWNRLEGNKCFNPTMGCRKKGRKKLRKLLNPIITYGTGSGGTCSVTGGYLYRGSAIPELRGKYVYSDYCSGGISVATRGGKNKWTTELALNSGFRVSSFGEDNDGELYVMDYQEQGAIYKIVAA